MLKDILQDIGVQVDEKQIALFDKYYENLVSWNEKFNLTAVTERKEVDLKHFADSVIAEKYFKQNARVVDVGSGAGFPAIPLKIVRPDLKITMLEALNKRVTFLKDTLNLLEIDGEALHLRAEEAARMGYKGAFDVATARAVARTEKLVGYLLPLVKKGGVAILYKSGEIEDELKEAQKTIAKLGGKIISADRHDFASFGRTIVVIEKIK